MGVTDGRDDGRAGDDGAVATVDSDTDDQVVAGDPDASAAEAPSGGGGTAGTLATGAAVAALLAGAVAGGVAGFRALRRKRENARSDDPGAEGRGSEAEDDAEPESDDPEAQADAPEAEAAGESPEANGEAEAEAPDAEAEDEAGEAGERHDAAAAHEEPAPEADEAQRSEPEARQEAAQSSPTGDATEDAGADEDREPHAEGERPDADGGGERDGRPGESTAQTIVAAAKQQLRDLTGREAESVSGLERRDDGWHVSLELVELSRTPSSTDVLASYEVVLDPDGELLEYGRTRRYYRSRADAEAD